MADSFLTDINTVHSMQTDMEAFAAEVELRRCTTLGEISDLCRAVHKNVDLHTRKRKNNNATRMSLWCRIPECSFQIVCTRKKAGEVPIGHYTLSEKNTCLRHETTDGLPCGGKRSLSASELLENVNYLAQKNSEGCNPKSKKKKTGGIVLSQNLVSAAGTGETVTKSVVKAADSTFVIKSVDYVESYKKLKPYLEVMKRLNPSMEYKIEKDRHNKVVRTLVLMPYAAHAMSACFNVIGIDTAHMSTIKLPKITSEQIYNLCEYSVPEGGGYLLEKMVVTVVSGRTYNNEMIILAYCLHYTESGMDAYKFFEFLTTHGVPLNRAEITIFTDRHNTYTAPVLHYFPLALHFLCPVHLKRNIIDNVPGIGASTTGVDSDVIKYYWKIQGALTKTEFDKLCAPHTVAALGPKYVLMMKYLDTLTTTSNWQLYKASVRNNVLHTIKSSNLVEQAHSWILEPRAYGSPYFFTVSIFTMIQVYLNTMKQEMKSSENIHRHLTPYAHNLYAKTQVQAAKEIAVVSRTCDEVGLPLKGSVTYGSVPNTHVYEVNFGEKNCNCLFWSQTGVPCKHAIMLRSSAVNTPKIAALSDFHAWCCLAPLNNMLRSIELVLPNIDVVDDVLATTTPVYKLYPSIICDPSASASSKRIASRGDTSSGGGQSVASSNKNKKIQCPNCGKWLSPKTRSHTGTVCFEYAKFHNFLPAYHNFTSEVNPDVLFAFESMNGSVV